MFGHSAIAPFLGVLGSEQKISTSVHVRACAHVCVCVYRPFCGFLGLPERSYSPKTGRNGGLVPISFPRLSVYLCSSLRTLRPTVEPIYGLFVERSVSPINNPARPHAAAPFPCTPHSESDARWSSLILTKQTEPNWSPT